MCEKRLVYAVFEAFLYFLFDYDNKKYMTEDGRRRSGVDGAFRVF